MDSVEDVFNMVEGAMKAGAAGISIGRNIFQDKDPKKILQALSLIVKEGKTAKEAMEVYNK